MSLQPIPSSLTCHYGAEASRVGIGNGGVRLDLELPHLGGGDSESIHAPGSVARVEAGFTLLDSPDLMVGCSMIEAGPGLADAARELYDGLLSVTEGRHLYRVWNYVPGINLRDDGLERYRQFNVGRWKAFEKAFGNHLRSHLPAASAVGIQGKKLLLVFAAGRLPARHLENPEQVPAYHYPDAYGPRSPGFARASTVGGNRFEASFISGTASIRGHASLHRDDVTRQLDVTLDNLDIMARQLETRLFDPGSRNDPWQIKCYLRHKDHHPLVSTLLEQRLGPEARRNCIFLQADICRCELDIEMEATRIRLG